MLNIDLGPRMILAAAAVVLTASSAGLLFYFVLWPVLDYFLDKKGLRKYPVLTLPVVSQI